MPFTTYLLHCADRTFYAGHTDDLERRLGQHERGAMGGYTATRLPVMLVWSEAFSTREEALAAERRIKGWSRAKKMALIRNDWVKVSTLAKARTPIPVRAEPVEAPSFFSPEEKEDPSTSSGRTGLSEVPAPEPQARS